jgi:hypothetical protein
MRPVHLCAEVSADGLLLCVCTQKAAESARFALPEGAFGDGRRMAEPAREWLAQKAGRRISSAVILANTRRTAIRFAQGPEEASFPYGELFNETTHVFSGEALPGKRVRLLAALPAELAGALTGMCGAWGLPLRAVKRIGVLELTLLKYFPFEAEYTLLCLPQDGGVRLIHRQDGQPDRADFISGDPAYREKELDRAILTRAYAPEKENALIFLPALTPPAETGERYGWLRVCLEAKGIGCETRPIPERIYADAAHER